MDFTLNNFDFKVDTLDNTTDIDNLLEEYVLTIKGFEVKLNNRSFQQDKAKNRSEDLDEDIAEVQAEITTKEAELANYTAGTHKHEEISIDLDSLRARLRRLNFRKSDTVAPFTLLERNADTGEAQLLLAYYTRLKEALETRKTEL